MADLAAEAREPFARFFVERDGRTHLRQQPFDALEVAGRMHRVKQCELTALERASLLEVDALSARLAQECALRAQAEQERDEARQLWEDLKETEDYRFVKARTALARYPEMTDAEAAEAAGTVAALLFSEQGASTDG